MKRLAALAGVLALLMIIGGALWLTRRPAAGKRPLAGVDFSNISRIAVKNEFGVVELEKAASGEGWYLSAPIKDVADPDIPRDILEALKDFTLGSVISENASKHAQFHVDDEHASRIQLFVVGSSSPVLDGYVGKEMSNNYQNYYFRFFGSTPVYVVSGMPHYLFQRQINGYRLMSAFPMKAVDVTSLAVANGKTNLELVKSSNTWTSSAGGAPLDDALVRPFLLKLEMLKATDFAVGNETAEKLGFGKPFLKVQVETEGKPVSFVVGSKAAGQPPALENRYAKSTGRDAVLIIHGDILKDLLASLKTISR